MQPVLQTPWRWALGCLLSALQGRDRLEEGVVNPSTELPALQLGSPSQRWSAPEEGRLTAMGRRTWCDCCDRPHAGPLLRPLCVPSQLCEAGRRPAGRGSSGQGRRAGAALRAGMRGARLLLVLAMARPVRSGTVVSVPSPLVLCKCWAGSREP